MTTSRNARNPLLKTSPAVLKRKRGHGKEGAWGEGGRERERGGGRGEEREETEMEIEPETEK